MSSMQSSFIPKRNPVNKSRRTVSRRVYTLTVISYVFLFAVLLASAGLFVYSQYTTQALQAEIAALSAAVASFDEQKLDAVKKFDRKLRFLDSTLEQSVSVRSVLTALEEATAETVVFRKFNYEHSAGGGIELGVEIETDTFDSSIFQRETFKDNDVITAISINDLTKAPATFGVTSLVTFDAVMEVASEEVRFVPGAPTAVSTDEAEEALFIENDEPVTTDVNNSL